MRRLVTAARKAYRAEAFSLAIAATGLAAGLLTLGLALRHLGLDRQWRLFVGGALVYTLVTFYLLNQIKPLRNRFRVTKMFVATLVIEAPVAVLWCLFYCDLLPLPASMLPYTIGGIVVAPAMVMLIESFVLSGRDT